MRELAGAAPQLKLQGGFRSALQCAPPPTPPLPSGDGELLARNRLCKEGVGIVRKLSSLTTMKSCRGTALWPLSLEDIPITGPRESYHTKAVYTSRSNK